MCVQCVRAECVCAIVVLVCAIVGVLYFEDVVRAVRAVAPPGDGGEAGGASVGVARWPAMPHFGSSMELLPFHSIIIPGA